MKKLYAFLATFILFSLPAQAYLSPTSGGSGGGGITDLNGSVSTTQSFATGTSGTDFTIVTASGVHTFNLPTASASNRGLLSASDYSTFAAGAASYTFTLPLLNTSGTVTCRTATGSVSGCLSAADFATFNGKQATVTTGNLDAQSANSKGVALVSNVVSMQSADATNPGLVNNTTQSFGGEKHIPALSVGTTSSPSGALLVDGGGVDVLQNPMELKNGSNANARWFFYINPSNGSTTYYNPNQNVTAWSAKAGGGFAVGGQAAQYTFDVNSADTSTDVTADPAIGNPVIQIRNSDTTVGNLEEYVLSNSTGAIVGKIVGVNENHSAAGSQTGSVQIHTRLAGVDNTNLILNSDSTITIPPQGSGVTPACSTGAHAGKTAYTSAFVLCVCNGSGWVHASTGLTACTF